MLILLDTTVLSNFALVGRPDLLRLALGSEVAATPQVMAEIMAGVALGRVPETDLEWLKVVALSEVEEESYQRFLRHLNQGEAACLAVAAHRPARVLTDDRDARAFAVRRGIAISGTLGVLVRLVKSQHLTVAQADDLLRQMIVQNYHSPVESIKELL